MGDVTYCSKTGCEMTSNVVLEVLCLQELSLEEVVPEHNVRYGRWDNVETTYEAS
jgi:hypothetical protein